jgi:fatty-acyl-CoA synthase
MNWELDWLESRARLTPNHIAIVDGETNQRWTYQQMYRRVQRLTKHLAGRGIIKGDRIALLATNHVCYFDLFFACRNLGAIFVPLNWRLSRYEIEYMLHDCSPKLLAFHSQCQELSVGAQMIDLLQIDGSEYEQIMDHLSEEDQNEGMDDKNGWLTNFHRAEMKENDPCIIIYTGGTTGKPKGVVLTNGSIFWNSVNTILSWNLTIKDVTLTYLPMFHTGGLNALSLPTLHCGGTVVIARDFDVEKTVQLLNQERCTIVLMVPTMYHMLIQSNSFQETEFPTMHSFLSGGAPCPHTIYQAFEEKGLPFKEGYGLTEAGPNNFYLDPSQSRIKRGSVGKPMYYNRIKLAAEDGSEVLPGEVGEILIQGGHVFDHYWNNPQATAEALCDGWLNTGDLGTKDQDGDYYIMGRKKDMIITGGENVYPLEIEHLISQHPAVKETAVFGLPDPKWGEVVTAAIVLQDGAVLTEKDLKEYCSRKLGRYKVPKKMIIVNELPKTPVGKIDKKEMKKVYASN